MSPPPTNAFDYHVRAFRKNPSSGLFDVSGVFERIKCLSDDPNQVATKRVWRKTCLKIILFSRSGIIFDTGTFSADWNGMYWTEFAYYSLMQTEVSTESSLVLTMLVYKIYISVEFALFGSPVTGRITDCIQSTTRTMLIWIITCLRWVPIYQILTNIKLIRTK